MPHPSFSFFREKEQKALLSLSLSLPSFLLECEPLKNVRRNFHRQEITNTASVGCVCGQQVNFTGGSHAGAPFLQKTLLLQRKQVTTERFTWGSGTTIISVFQPWSQYRRKQETFAKYNYRFRRFSVIASFKSLLKTHFYRTAFKWSSLFMHIFGSPNLVVCF